MGFQRSVGTSTVAPFAGAVRVTWPESYTYSWMSEKMPLTPLGSSSARTRQYVGTPWPCGPQKVVLFGEESIGEKVVPVVTRVLIVAGENCGSVETWIWYLVAWRTGDHW